MSTALIAEMTALLGVEPTLAPPTVSYAAPAWLAADAKANAARLAAGDLVAILFGGETNV